MGGMTEGHYYTDIAYIFVSGVTAGIYYVMPSVPATVPVNGTDCTLEFWIAAQPGSLAIAGVTANTGRDHVFPIPATIPIIGIDVAIIPKRSVTDATFTKWLKADAPREILAELQIHRSTPVEGDSFAVTAETLYFSALGYVTDWQDWPTNQCYEDRISDIPHFSVSTDANIGYGELAIRNPDGEYDWLLDYRNSVDGHQISLFIGDPAWRRQDFRALLTGIVDDISSASMNEIRIAIRDKTEKLNKPISTTTFPDGAAMGQYQPLLWGWVYNIEPVCTDNATLTYCYGETTAVPDTADGTISVRDNGVALATAQVTWPTPGYFQLANQPAGKITADLRNNDVYWAAYEGGWSNERFPPVGIAVRILQRAGILDTEIGLSSWAALKTAMWPWYSAGIYVKDRTNAAELLQQLLNPLGIYWYWDRDGLIRAFRLDVPSILDTVFNFDVDDLVQDSLRLVKRDLPWLKVQVKGGKNYAPQDADALAGAVTAENRVMYGKDFQVTASFPNDTPARDNRHPGALTPDPVETFLRFEGVYTDHSVTQFDGIYYEAVRVAGIKAYSRNTWQLETFFPMSPVQIGSTVTLTHPRFGFSADVAFVVIGIEERPLDGRTTFTFWG